MTRILFVCLGNICRSPMAEFALKEMVTREKREDLFQIESAAISDINNDRPVYREARRKLMEHGIDCTGKYARQLSASDYAEFDLLIGMDQANLRGMRRICGGDPEDKIHLLMEYTERPGEIDEPWYTGDFDTAWQDIEDGCRGLLAWLDCDKGQ